MKVKVGKKVYDGSEVPVMVILNKRDKSNIRRMSPKHTKYCSYPMGKFSEREIVKFMKVKNV